jgi:WD40 repeat protein
MDYKDLAEFDTKLTADVVEWRPIQSDNDTSKILACGTYFLDKEKGQRLGCLYLLEFDELAQKQLRILNTINYSDSGILDMKWLNSDQLITIDSNNSISLFEFINNENSKSDNFDLENSNLLLKKANLKLNDNSDSSIGLTIDFSKEANSYRLLTSDTKGILNILNLDNEQFNSRKQFKAHDYEIWSVLLDKHDENIVYSGADDCTLAMWDLREPAVIFEFICCFFLNNSKIISNLYQIVESKLENQVTNVPFSMVV